MGVSGFIKSAANITENVSASAKSVLNIQLPSLITGTANAISETIQDQRRAIIFTMPQADGSSRVVTLKVNPSHMRLIRKPTINTILTRDGLVNQFWRPQPDKLTFSGFAMGKKIFDVLADFQSVVNSINSTPALCSNLITMTFREGEYKGFIEGDISFERDAETPRKVNYSFTFVILEKVFEIKALPYPKSDYDTIKDAANYFSNIPVIGQWLNEQAMAVAGAVKGASNAAQMVMSYVDRGIATVNGVSETIKATSDIMNKISGAAQIFGL